MFPKSEDTLKPRPRLPVDRRHAMPKVARTFHPVALDQVDPLEQHDARRNFGNTVHQPLLADNDTIPRLDGPSCQQKAGIKVRVLRLRSSDKGLGRFRLRFAIFQCIPVICDASRGGVERAANWHGCPLSHSISILYRGARSLLAWVTADAGNIVEIDSALIRTWSFDLWFGVGLRSGIILYMTECAE